MSEIVVEVPVPEPEPVVEAPTVVVVEAPTEDDGRVDEETVDLAVENERLRNEIAQLREGQNEILAVAETAELTAEIALEVAEEAIADEVETVEETESEPDSPPHRHHWAHRSAGELFRRE